MAHVRTGEVADREFLRTHERHVAPGELDDILRRRRVLVAETSHQIVGWLRWGLFWDTVPFMNMLFVLDQYRGSGVGGALVRRWEQQMAAEGHHTIMTSTRADESAQHFYRRLGYVDTGSLILPGEPTEILLRKEPPS